MSNRDYDTLDKLIEDQIVAVNEDGLPVRTEKYSKAEGRCKNYSSEEVVAIVLPYVYEDITVSDRKLAELTNDKLLNLRFMVLEELEKILKDKNLNANTKIKAIHEILVHSVSVAELTVNAGKEVKSIDINVLLAELDNM